MTDYLDRSTHYEDSRIANAFDQLSLWSSRFGALLFDHLRLHRGLAVLDVGCGAGFPLLELAEIHGPTCRFVGVDLWKAGIERAAEKLAILNLPHVRLVRGDGARLPFADSRFDLIVSNLGVNNFRSSEEAWRECARVAKRGARLVLTTNLKGHFTEFYRLYRQTLMEMGKTAAVARLDVEENHRSTRAALTESLERHGFKVTRAIEETFALRYLNGGSLLRHTLTVFGFLDGWRGVVSSDIEREVFSRLEAELDEVARQQGELRMTVPMLYLEGLYGGSDVEGRTARYRGR